MAWRKSVNWIKAFLFGQSIQVRVGSSMSERYEVDNGIPQGSVNRPFLFSIIIDNVFSKVRPNSGCKGCVLVAGKLGAGERTWYKHLINAEQTPKQPKCTK